MNPMQYFNRHLEADVVAILDASAALEVTEFRLFELAFHDWYGKKADESQIEKYFAAYMFVNRVPSWVRHFARKVLSLHAQGKLNPKSFGVWTRLPNARMRLVAKLYTVALFVVFVTLILSAFSLPQELLAAFQGCYLPPCY